MRGDIEQYGPLATQFAIDAGLIGAGGFLIATSPFDAGAGAVAGETLLGAGVSGAIYDTTAAATGQQANWGDWGIQLGIGAATGLIGGFAAGAARAGLAGYRATYFALKIAGGATRNLTGQMLNNLAAGQDLSSGLLQATLSGAAEGAMKSGYKSRSKFMLDRIANRLNPFRTGAKAVGKKLARGGLEAANKQLGLEDSVVNWFDGYL
jgi:hypothetical protein